MIRVFLNNEILTVKNIMEKIIILLFVSSSFLVACDDGKRLPKRDNAGVACTEDMKVCPNGDYVARNPDNNCQFDPCSSGSISNDCTANGGCAPQIILPAE